MLGSTCKSSVKTRADVRFSNHAAKTWNYVEVDNGQTSQTYSYTPHADHYEGEISSIASERGNKVWYKNCAQKVTSVKVRSRGSDAPHRVYYDPVKAIS